MNSEMILTGGTIVTRTQKYKGTVCLEKGLIKSVDQGKSVVPDRLDLEGDYLLPGLIELHTDNMEKHMAPRPEVLWPSPLTSFLVHDNQIACAGITTVLDCLFLGAYKKDSLRPAILGDSIASLKRARELGIAKADHFMHMRCELPDDGLAERFEPHVGQPDLKLVSLNDHTPGQRQWRDMVTYRTYHRSKDMPEDEFQALVAHRKSLQAKNAGPNRAVILNHCRVHALPLASHDDTTIEDVVESAGDGVKIAEFPTTRAAAQKARALGLKIVAGAPNLVRGGSHSANVSARELAREGLLDIMSSDYFPAGLLEAAFFLHHHMEFPLPDAVAKVTANPAGAVGFQDRGQIAPGLRADLIRVAIKDGLPVVRGVWREGRRVI